VAPLRMTSFIGIRRVLYQVWMEIGGGGSRLLRECPTHPAMRPRDEWGTRSGGGLEWVAKW
jgi:hypothetical protein